MVNCIAPTVRDLAELLEAYTGIAKHLDLPSYRG